MTAREKRIPELAGDAFCLWRAQGSSLEAFLHRAEDVALALGEIAVAMAALGYPSEDIWGVQLALDESILNGLQHGNQGDPAKHVRVRCYIGTEVVMAEVEDQGAGFNPALVPNPLLPENLERDTGRGLLLMRHFMTGVAFSERGNHVTLFKRRSPYQQPEGEPPASDLAMVVHSELGV
jgi:serine/threonine-protein kinase RsbW